jgi:hypothetical protein
VLWVFHGRRVDHPAPCRSASLYPDLALIPLWVCPTTTQGGGSSSAPATADDGVRARLLSSSDRGDVFLTQMSGCDGVCLRVLDQQACELTSLQLSGCAASAGSAHGAPPPQCRVLSKVSAVGIAPVNFGTTTTATTTTDTTAAAVEVSGRAGAAVTLDGLLVLAPGGALRLLLGEDDVADVVLTWPGVARAPAAATVAAATAAAPLLAICAPPGCGGFFVTTPTGARFFGALHTAPTSPLLRQCLEMLDGADGLAAAGVAGVGDPGDGGGGGGGGGGGRGGKAGVGRVATGTVDWKVNVRRCVLELRQAYLPRINNEQNNSDSDWDAFAASCVELFCQGALEEDDKIPAGKSEGAAAAEVAGARGSAVVAGSASAWHALMSSSSHTEHSDASLFSCFFPTDETRRAVGGPAQDGAM